MVSISIRSTISPLDTVFYFSMSYILRGMFWIIIILCISIIYIIILYVWHGNYKFVLSKCPQHLKYGDHFKQISILVREMHINVLNYSLLTRFFWVIVLQSFDNRYFYDTDLTKSTSLVYKQDVSPKLKLCTVHPGCASLPLSNNGAIP